MWWYQLSGPTLEAPFLLGSQMTLGLPRWAWHWLWPWQANSWRRLVTRRPKWVILLCLAFRARGMAKQREERNEMNPFRIPSAKFVPFLKFFHFVLMPWSPFKLCGYWLLCGSEQIDFALILALIIILPTDQNGFCWGWYLWSQPSLDQKAIWPFDLLLQPQKPLGIFPLLWDRSEIHISLGISLKILSIEQLFSLSLVNRARCIIRNKKEK